ncbi:MAG: hypothetical protein JW723_14485 [Bacteroidales bacterium]|nr:hypothetical protein [Bacteroidales bacterium]
MMTYQAKDLEMLLTCKTIADNFAANIQELRKADKNWTDEYLVSMLNRVDRAFNYYLGLEANREIEQVRNKLNNIQTQALRAVAFLKTRIEVIYALDEKRKNQVLDKLGFHKYLQAIQEKDTDVLLELLSKIKDNLSEDIKNDLIKSQGDKNFIERIYQFANKLNKANRSQNSLMATKKAIAEDAREVYNNLLLDILDISEKATEFYQDSPEKIKLFDYSFIAQNKFVSSDS